MSMSNKIVWTKSNDELFEIDEAIALQSHLSFRDLADRTLALQSGSDDPIKKFSLKFNFEDRDEDREVGYRSPLAVNASKMAYVSPWICTAVERGVLELDLSFKTSHVVDLPPELFTSNTLIKLTLGAQICVWKLPPYVSLPALKSLYIDSIVFPYPELCDVLLAGCPVLEDLVVIHEGLGGIPPVISNRTIKKLKVHYDDEFELDFMRSTRSFDAPSLVSLDYSDYALSEDIPVNLPSLVEARLDLRSSEKIWKPNISSLMNGISNVQTLHLSPDSADVISRCVANKILLPKFNNLVHLSFGFKNKRGWKLLPYLLRQSPKTKTLIIKDLMLPQYLIGYTSSNISMPRNKVKELHILGYQGTPEELQRLKIFLGDFECLELLQVDIMEEDEDRKLQATMDLAMLSGVYVGSNCHFKVT